MTAAAATTIDAVVCAYTLERWQDLLAAVTSLQAQTTALTRIVVVVDHNEDLLRLARAELPEVVVVANIGRAGLSGARNTGTTLCSADVVAFLDDDAVAAPDWAARLLAPYDSVEHPFVLSTGGSAEPGWPDDADAPAWFPPEFGWVVGCSYLGQPTALSVVRNPLGCSMSFRREELLAAGGFTEGMGRVGSLPLGCEETELAIRLRHKHPGSSVVLDPEAVVRHNVTAQRARLSYFIRRCRAEGTSKALLASLTDTGSALESERTYVARTLPRGVLRGMVDGVHGDRSGWLRAAAIGIGLAATTVGYGRGRLAVRRGELAVPRLPSVATTGLTPEFGTLDPGPTGCHEVDVAGVSPPAWLEQTHYPRPVRVLFQLHGEPLDNVDLAPELFADWSSVWRDRASAPVTFIGQLGEAGRRRLAHHLAEDGSGSSLTQSPDALATALAGVGDCSRRIPAQLPKVSVIVATLGRESTLKRCLRSILNQEHPADEVLVVDNDPTNPRTRALCDSLPGVRWIPEPIRGAAVARNTGISAATGEVLMFTDDDAIVSPTWVADLTAVYANDLRVTCVTGLVLPTNLGNEAHQWFENYGSFDKGFDARCWSLEDPDNHPLFPWTPGRFGSGNNMSLRADTMKLIGGFDPALGPGTPTRSAEDLDIFIRVLQAGGTLAYEPRALVRHAHRETLGELRIQVHGYGVGLGALFTKHVLTPNSRTDILRRLPRGTRLLLSSGSEKNSGKGHSYPVVLTRDELRGVLGGPAAYLRSRKRSAARAHPPLVRSPLRVHDWDLGTGSSSAALGKGFPETATSSWLFVRRGSRIVGATTVASIAPAELAEHAYAVERAAPERPLPAAAGEDRLPSFTVVVPSMLARAQGLLDCLASLRLLDYDPARFDVIVVDNRPSTARQVPTWLLSETGLHLLRETRPGISAARNAGLAAATGQFVAFADDDALVDPGWLRALALGFAAAPDVTCVTGLVAPRQLATTAQLLFEEWGSSTARGFDPTIFRLVSPGSFRVSARSASGVDKEFSLYATGDFGIGSNMAFDAAKLRSAGGFDEALGVGTASRAGEDLAVFLRLLRRGEALGYAPDALTWHAHRTSVDELTRQLHGYGIGFTAMLSALIAEDPRHILGLGQHLAAGITGLRDAGSAKNTGRGPDFPAELGSAELRGMLAGPLWYLRSRYVLSRDVPARATVGGP